MRFPLALALLATLTLAGQASANPLQDKVDFLFSNVCISEEYIGPPPCQVNVRVLVCERPSPTHPACHMVECHPESLCDTAISCSARACNVNRYVRQCTGIDLANLTVGPKSNCPGPL